MYSLKAAENTYEPDRIDDKTGVKNKETLPRTNKNWKPFRMEYPRIMRNTHPLF